jgi:hypothetical protein
MAGAFTLIGRRPHAVTWGAFESTNMKTTAAVTALAIALSGCAVGSIAVPTAAVPYTQYRNYDCDMLAAESDRLTVKVQNLGARLDQAASNDQGVMAVSLLLFWPAVFALGNKPQEAEYGYLKGQHDAVQQAAIVKKCPGLVGPPSMQPAVAPTLSPTAYQPTSVQGAAAAQPPRSFRPAACDWGNTKQGSGAC